MQSQRSKTQRRRGPSTPAAEMVIGPFQNDNVIKSTEDSLDALFAAETENTFHQPWQKLDRGSRLDRLRKFVQTYPDLTLAERASLLTAVLQAFELRQLNTKLAVDYNHAVAAIQGIRGLREKTSSAGLKTFRIDSGAARATTRRVPKATTVQPAPAVLNDQPTM